MSEPRKGVCPYCGSDIYYDPTQHTDVKCPTCNDYSGVHPTHRGLLALTPEERGKTPEDKLPSSVSTAALLLALPVGSMIAFIRTSDDGIRVAFSHDGETTQDSFRMSDLDIGGVMLGFAHDLIKKAVNR